MSSNGYGPSFVACKLYRKRSQSSGSTYFTGRMGGVKVAILKSKEVAGDGGEIWHLVLSEAPVSKNAVAAKRDLAKPATRPHGEPELL